MPYSIAPLAIEHFPEWDPLRTQAIQEVNMNEQNQQQTTKEYEPPQVTDYGTLSEQTAGGFTNSNPADGAIASS